MKLSPYYKVFEEDAVSWEEKLNRVDATFDVWIVVQRRWVYLEASSPAAPTSRRCCPTEFLTLMKKVSKSPMVLDVLNIQGVMRSLERLPTCWEDPEALGEYLERERSSSPVVMESQVTIEVEIPQKHHGTVMGARGMHVQKITQNHQVQIKFPDRADPNALPPAQNGSEEPEAGPRRCDLIRVTGPEAACLAARDALLALVPITIEVEVPFDYHRFIIGQKGKGVRDMMRNFDVNISIPPAEELSNVIRITGTPDKLDDAREGLLQRVKELDAEKADRELRSFTLTMRVNPDYHPKIIGRKGAVISKIRLDHEVNVQFPQKDSEEPDLITITGYEEKAHAAEAAIRQIVGDLESQSREELRIDPRVHARIIGGRGKNIRAIMNEFQVDVRFPRYDDPEPDLVVITGAEDAVFECAERLRNLEEEYMQDVVEREEMNAHVRGPRDTGYNGESTERTDRAGFVVSGAPWQQQQQQQAAAGARQPPARSMAPNMASAEEFPSFGDAANRTPVVWGPRR
ncbi:Vigilin [Amphibalanus amphitrite]|uniref:Vigilin n=1 Tax=Amphibalanus amphitrite TaxID=1232801 RepID=A0A6A4VNF9_AMPAM|nr:Vigilin [Amphibalanus amphitrite]